jgi:hypothetical protein
MRGTKRCYCGVNLHHAGRWLSAGGAAERPDGDRGQPGGSLRSRHVQRCLRHDGGSLHGENFHDRTGVALIHGNRHHPVPRGGAPIANL